MRSKVEQRFNKASKTYDSVSFVQKTTADIIAKKLQNAGCVSPTDILDCGTGTGLITQLLLSIYPDARYYLNDIAVEMLNICRIKFKGNNNITYIHKDMYQLDDTVYDCVVSNLVLQWADDLSKAIKFLYNKSGKYFAFSTLLDGSFDNWIKVVETYQPVEFISYPSVESLINICKFISEDFVYEIEEVTINFNSVREVLGYFQKLGASATYSIMSIPNIRRMVSTYKDSIDIKYKVFIGLYKKGN